MRFRHWAARDKGIGSSLRQESNGADVTIINEGNGLDEGEREHRTDASYVHPT
jgi:hypothetical protein